MPSRSVPLLLLSALAVAGLGVPSVAAPSRATEFTSRAGTYRWSDPAAWGGTVPGAGDRVTIASGSKVVLDSSTPALSGIQVDGTLTFARQRLNLTTDWLVVHGTFRIGTTKKPFLQDAVITLTGNDRSQDIMDMGTKVLGVMGGTLDLHGAPVRSWTHLSANADAGDDSIVLSEPSEWRPGDRIVIASSDYWRHHDDEATVTRVDGNVVELDEPLDYPHWGVVQTIEGRQVDERAEVGLLTRSITIRGDESSSADGFGGQVMVMEGGRARIAGVELTRVGQRKTLRRYPIHFHMDGSAKGSYVKNSSIHKSYNRCVTVHGTNQLVIKDNVCFDHEGHGFFFEDGAETDNKLIGNLGLGTKEVEDGLLPTDQRPATFWITNPDNIVRGNVAAGSDGNGFWYALPEHPTGLSTGDTVWPRRTPLGEFSGNVAHSNGDNGLNVDDGPRPNGQTESTWYSPIADPTDPKSGPVVARFEGFTGYMNRDRGVWLRGANHVVTGAVLADNRAGATFASNDTYLEDSLVVGETNNPGTPEPWEDAAPDGSALPLFWAPETPIVGFEFYDGKVGTRNTTFVRFRDNSLRPSGALGYLEPDAFSIHPQNFAEGATFLDADPVHLSEPEPGMDGDLSKVFIDRDGSVTGEAGAAVVVDNQFLVTDACTPRPAWNAHVCPAGYVSLWVSTNGGSSAIKPLTLTRADGVRQTLNGCCDDSEDAVTTILPERTYDVDFATGLPSEATFVLWRGRGSWVRLTLNVPTQPDVTRWGSKLAEVSSLTALDERATSGFFYDGVSNTLHVKLAAQGDWEEVVVRS